MFSYINVIWYTIAVWRTVDAPRFHAGFTAAAVFGAAMICLTVILQFLQKRDERKRAQENGAVGDVEATEEGAPRTSIAEAATASVKDGVTPQR